MRPAYDHGCMRGQMMDFQLTLPHLLRRAETYFARKEIVTRLARPLASTATTYARPRPARSKQLAVALAGLGLERGDRVATLCWNHYAAPGVLLRHPLRRARAAHAQPASAPERPRVHRRPRGRPRRDRRPSARTAARPVPRPDRRSSTSSSSRTRTRSCSPAPRPTTARDPELDENEAAAMCYTSGTTGQSEGRRLLAPLDDAAHARRRVGRPLGSASRRAT